MKKQLLTVSALLFSAILLTGCDNSTDTSETETEQSLRQNLEHDKVEQEENLRDECQDYRGDDVQMIERCRELGAEVAPEK